MTAVHPELADPATDIALLRDEQGRKGSSIDWERLLTISYRQYVEPGGVVIDVGAHNGMHARRFRRYLRPSQLVLVEPIPELAAGLRREFARRSSVEICEVALSNEPGSATFVVNESSPGESGLLDRHEADQGHQTRELTVTVERLDDWELSGPVRFVKIDVEGGELDVLRGADELIRRDRPIMSVEYAPGSAGIYGRGNGDLLGNELPLDRVDDWAGVYYWDFVLMPRERLATATEDRRAVRSAAFHAIETFNPTVERWKKRLRR